MQAPDHPALISEELPPPEDDAELEFLRSSVTGAPSRFSSHTLILCTWCRAPLPYWRMQARIHLHRERKNCSKVVQSVFAICGTAMAARCTKRRPVGGKDEWWHQ